MLEYPPPECANVEIRELNPDGSLRRIIPPRQTPEQKKAEEEKRRQSAECDERNEAQRQENEALIRRYPIEDDLIVARDRTLANEKARLDQQNQRLKDLKVARARLEDEKALYKGRQLPDALQADFKANDSSSAAAEHQVEVLNSEMEQIAKKFAADLKRYRELVNGTVKMPCSVKSD